MAEQRSLLARLIVASFVIIVVAAIVAVAAHQDAQDKFRQRVTESFDVDSSGGGSCPLHGRREVRHCALTSQHEKINYN